MTVITAVSFTIGSNQLIAFYSDNLQAAPLSDEALYQSQRPIEPTCPEKHFEFMRTRNVLCGTHYKFAQCIRLLPMGTRIIRLSVFFSA